MAVDLSVGRLFLTTTPAIQRPYNTQLSGGGLKTSIFPRIRQKPFLCSKSSLGFPTPRPCFKPFVRTTQDSEPEVGEKTLKGKVSERPSSDLKNLIDAYKEAILNGDEKTVFEIEAFFRKLEDEKIELAEKVGALLADIASQKENFIRTQADFENFRKQFEKDQLRLTSNTQKDVIESLLLVVDNFEKAKQHIVPVTEKGQKINTSYQSIYKQFVEILRSLRVSVVQTVGKPFDPLLHEAIAREESQQFKEGVIIQETRRGFLLGDQVLRPAVVKVSTGSGHKKAPIPTEESEGQPATAQ